jgi:hypothetical protein
MVTLGAMLLAFACGREGSFSAARFTTAAAVPASDPVPPSADPTSTPVADVPDPQPPVVAVPTSAPAPKLPAGPDGSDDSKSDSGVRGRVMAADRPVADAVVSVRGQGYQSNSTSGRGGRFLIEAPSGIYLVGATANNGIVRCSDRIVRVGSTSFTTVTIACRMAPGP